MSRERGRRAVLLPPQETIDKLEKTANAGSFYEAQQMYKSITARYAAAERYDDTLDILESGASVQLKNGQVICGAELAVLFVETLVKGKIPCSEESLVVGALIEERKYYTSILLKILCVCFALNTRLQAGAYTFLYLGKRLRYSS